MLNFTERTGCGAVMLVWSFPTYYTPYYYLYTYCYMLGSHARIRESQVTSHSTSFVFDKMPTCLRTASDTRIFNVINTEIAREEQVEHGKGKSWRPGSSCMTIACWHRNANNTTHHCQLLSHKSNVFIGLCKT